MEQRNELDIARLNTKIESIEGTIGVHDKRITAQGKQIDELNKDYNNMKTDMELLKLTNNNILDNTKDIKHDVKAFKVDLDRLSENHNEEIASIRALRDRDHLYEPKQKIEKYRDDAIKVVIGAFVMSLLYQIAPFLK